jgi:hypothetical protein
MNRAGALVLVIVAACGTSDTGEPIGGTVSVIVGDQTITPTVGAAIADPADETKAILIVGTTTITCETTLNSRLPPGTYLTFGFAQTTGMQSGFVSVIRVEGSSAHLNASTGDIVIDTLDPRVTGSVTFDTTDDMVGPISAAGTFDVIRCF